MTQESQKTEPAPVQPPKAKIEAGGKLQAIIPQDIDQCFRMAEAIFRSGMYPDSYAIDENGKSGRNINANAIDAKGTMSRIMIGIQKALEVGLKPITGLSTIYIVNNRPTIFGDGVPALLYGSGKIEYIKEWTEGEFGKDEYTAFCEIKRKDQPEPIRGQFSWGDAKKARLTTKSGPWTDYPKRQMQMRARGFATRDGAADILSGLSVYEEVMDIPEAKAEVNISSLDDAETIVQPETQAQPEQKALPVPDNSDVFSLSLEDEPEKVPSALPLAPNQQKKFEAQRHSVTTDDMKCQKCHGKGYTVDDEADPETGEILEAMNPCDCQQKRGFK